MFSIELAPFRRKTRECFMQVTALVSLSQSSDLPTEKTPREFDAVDEFAAALGEALNVSVPVTEGVLADAPPTGYVLVFDLGRKLPTGLGPRVVAINEHRGDIMHSIETHDLVAAIEQHRYFEWRTRRWAERGDGVVGRKDVAVHMHARVVSGPYTSPRYGLVAIDAAPDLVSLLATYLIAHEQVVGGQ